MNYNQILDDVLRELVKESEGKSTQIKPAQLLKDNAALNDLDKHLICQMFVKDGYASETAIPNHYRITFLGKMFIDDGGYIKASQRDAENEKRLKDVETQAGNISIQMRNITIVLAFAAVIAAVYYLNEMFHFLPCFC